MAASLVATRAAVPGSVGARQATPPSHANQPRTVLVTGGAGYIGSHTVQQLCRMGRRVVVVDDLSHGHRSALGAPLIVADVGNRPVMARLMRDERVDAVVHFAGFASVGESVADPGMYFANNLCGTQHLLDAMVDAGVRSLVFSSSCSVYGQPERLPVTEEQPLRPESPYGESKLMVERMLRWYEQAHGLRAVCLRYFNVAGASLDGSIGDDVRPPTRLVPIALEAALGKRASLTLYGDNYGTPDGTCVRDYVHVVDIADAHDAALGYLERGGHGTVFNLGAAAGISNRMVLDTVMAVTGRRFPVVIAPRRPGDPAAVYADNARARRVLGWEPRHSDLETIVRTAWRWRSAHPEGYPD